MMTAQATQEDGLEDDFFIVEDIDLSDESELRRIVAEVEALVGIPGKGLRVSVLSAEQWQTVLTRWLPPARRRGAAYHTHALRDPRDGQHLVVSPSGVRGINERQANMYEEIVYWLLRCLPTPLQKNALRAGTEDIVAELCGKRIGIEFYARHAPRESAFVRGLITVLIQEFKHQESDWARLLRRQPDRFFLALRKTAFCRSWLTHIQTEQKLASNLSAESDKRSALVAMLRDEGLSMSSSFARLTEEAIINYLESSNV